MKRAIIGMIGSFFTMCGIYLLFHSHLTDGLLALIVGELVDLPYRIKEA